MEACSDNSSRESVACEKCKPGSAQMAIAGWLTNQCRIQVSLSDVEGEL